MPMKPYPWPPRDVATMTDVEIKADLADVEARMKESQDSDDEGCGGSPGEWMLERAEELQATLDKRMLKALGVPEAFLRRDGIEPCRACDNRGRVNVPHPLGYAVMNWVTCSECGGKGYKEKPVLPPPVDWSLQEPISEEERKAREAKACGTMDADEMFAYAKTSKSTEGLAIREQLYINGLRDCWAAERRANAWEDTLRKHLQVNTVHDLQKEERDFARIKQLVVDALRGHVGRVADVPLITDAAASVLNKELSPPPADLAGIKVWRGPGETIIVAFPERFVGRIDQVHSLTPYKITHPVEVVRALETKTMAEVAKDLFKSPLLDAAFLEGWAPEDRGKPIVARVCDGQNSDSLRQVAVTEAIIKAIKEDKKEE